MVKSDVMEWKLSKTDEFWTDVVPGEHVLQIYKEDEDLINMLAGFIGTGINSGDSAIVIATRPHLEALEQMLQRHGVHTESLIEGNRYIPLDAATTLSSFMVNDWPDRDLFMKEVSRVITRAKGFEGRRVRAFGEMVTLTWKQGLHEATLELENLWNEVCKKEKLCLFCAYPHSEFENNPGEAIPHICKAHSRIVTGAAKPLIEIKHRMINDIYTSNMISESMGRQKSVS